MYELAKPSQLRAAPPLRDAGLPGVTPSFWDHVRRIRFRKTGCRRSARSRQKHAVHGKCFYTHILWAILTGYLC